MSNKKTKREALDEVKKELGGACLTASDTRYLATILPGMFKNPTAFGPFPTQARINLLNRYVQILADDDD